MNTRNERYINSIEGKATALKDQFRNFITLTLSSDMVKGFLDATTSLMSGLNGVLTSLDKIGMATPVAVAGLSTLFMYLKGMATKTNLSLFGAGMFDNIKKQQTQIITNARLVRKDLSNISVGTTHVLTKNSNAVAKKIQVNNARIKGVMGSSSKSFQVYSKDASGSFQRVADMSSKSAMHVVGSQTKIQRSFAQTAGSMALSTLKTTALNVGIGLLNGALIGLAMTLISKAVSALDDYIHRAEKAHEATANAVQKTQASISELNTQRTTLKQVAQGYEELANKTNLTSDEMEQLSQYKNQLAEMYPDLVTGYDENADPILAIGNNVDDLIEKLNEAIAKEQELLSREKARLGKDAGKVVGKYRTNLADNEGMYDHITQGKNVGSDLFSGNAKFEESIKNYRESIDKLKTQLGNIETLYAEKWSEYAELESQQQESAKIWFNENNKNFTNLGGTQKAVMNDLINTYDWSNELVADNIAKRNEFLRGFDKIAEHSVDHYKDVEKWNKVLVEANNAFQDSGDMVQYQKDIKKVCKEFENLTDIDAKEWMQGFTQQLEGSLDYDQMMLNNYLKGFGKSLIDLEFDKTGVTQKLKAQFEEVHSFMEAISDEGIDYQARMNMIVEVGQGKSAYKNLPPQLQAIFKGITDGRSRITEQETQLAVRLSAIIEQYGTVGDGSSIITKMLNGQLTDEEIGKLSVGISLPDGSAINKETVKAINEANKDRGDKNIEVDIDKENAETQLEELKKKFKDFKLLAEREDVQMLFTTNVVGEDKLALVEEAMEKLPIDEESTIELVTQIGEGWEQIETYEDIIGYLLEHPEVVSKVGIEFINPETIDRVKTSIDGLLTTEKENKIQITIEEGLAEGNITKIRDAIDKLPEEKQIKVATAISEALKGLDTVDAIKIRDKIIATYLEDPDNVEEKIDKVDKKSEKKATKSVMFREVGFSDTMGMVINVDEHGNPVAKQVDFGTTGFEDTIQKEDAVDGKSEDQEKVITIKTDGVEITIGNEKEVDKNAEDKTKTVTVKSKGDKDVIDKEEEVSEKAKDETKTVTFTAVVSKTLSSWFDKLNGFIGKSTVKVGLGNSNVDQFRKISNSPVEMDSPIPMSVNDGEVSLMSADNDVSDVSATAVGGFGSIGSSTTLDTAIDVNFDKILYSIKNSIKIFQELENRISRCTNQLNLLNKQMDRATGTEKIKHLQKQNELYEEQAKLQKQYYDYMVQQRSAVSEKLTKDYGFKVDEQGNLVDYEEKLIEMQKQYDKLNDAYEKATESEQKYNSSTKSSSKSNSSSTKASEKAKKALDDYKEKFDEAKKLSDEYISTQFTDLPKLEQEWQELQNSIKNNNDEIEKLVREDKIYKFKNSISALSNQFDILNNTLGLIDAKLEYADSLEQIELYNKKSDAIKKQQEATAKLVDEYKKMADVYKEDLSTYGFMFDELGNVVNYDEVLNAHQNQEDLEKINDLLKEFIDLQNKELPDSIKQWEELGNQFKDLQKEKLDKVQTIEDKITDIYRDEVDKRKEAIQKQYDDAIDKINKQKEAYGKKNEEDEYNKNLSEQQKKIADLQKQIDKFSRDDSTSSQSKVKELLDELADEKQNLDDLIKERQDTLINDMFDEEIDKLQSGSDEAIKELEEQWSEKKIFEMAQKVLQDGIFTDIDGNIISLQDKLIQFAEESGDALGIMADVVKNDLVNNLGVALEYVKEYKDIVDSLSLKPYGTPSYGDNSNSNSSNTTTIGDVIINVNGVNNPVDTAKEIENKLEEILNRI